MMTLPPTLRDAISLRERARLQGVDAALIAPDISVSFDELAQGNPLSVPPERLRGARVLVRTDHQLSAALALLTLDGIAARLVIAPPDLKDEYLDDVVAR